MDSAEKIQEISTHINQSLLYKVANGMIHFVESGKQATLNSLFISGLEQVVAINHDVFVPAKIVLFDFEAFRKTCDGVFLGFIGNKAFILIFDVKSSDKDIQNHIMKMKAGKNFVNYLNNSLQIFGGFNIDEFIPYYCIFHLKVSEKRTTNLNVGISQNPKVPTYIAVENNEKINIRKILGITNI